MPKQAPISQVSMTRRQRKARTPSRTKGKPVPDITVDEPFPGQIWVFFFLMLASVGLRLWLLLVSRHYLRSDEAVVAMEALDIMEGGPIPFFLYGQHYGGGHTVEALMAIPWFALFGPADYFLKLGPLILSCLYILVVYLCLYQFFNKKYALIAVTAFSFFAPFLYFNFLSNGGMAMSLFGWLGIYIFFRVYFANDENFWAMILSGATIGFAYYCFEYALYYFAAIILLWILKGNFYRWKLWQSILGFLAGFFVGASPLIYYNLTHDFANLQFLFSAAAQPDSIPVLSTLLKFARLLYQNLPAFFSQDVDDFPLEISPISYLSYGFFVISFVYVIIKTKFAIVSLMRAPFARHLTLLPREDRVVYLLFLIILYFAIYSAAAAGGSTPRYLITLCPLIPMILAWAAYDLAKRRVILSVILVVMFGATQSYFITAMARDDTTVEWRIPLHGEDIKTLSQFLLITI
jgi:4-amino-4-deoxy-L-arabinose transferase-like glycosyltransferase